MTDLPNPPSDFQSLRRVSARFGSDTMHIQGAGGNASIKDDDAMWIKASGTLLGTALDRDIFVATDTRAIRAALNRGDTVADQPATFALDPTCQLRPSIETSLHAVFDQRVVLHTHCIHTLAFAVQQDAKAQLANKLEGFDWSFVDYTKPGANLARSVSASLRPGTNVVVLANHGLIVAGETADAVAELQERVHRVLAQPVLPSEAPKTSYLEKLAENTEFSVPDDPFLHQLALDPRRVAQVSTGSLYPDHVIFCGIAVPVMRGNEGVNDALHRIAASKAPPPRWFLVSGGGVLVRRDLPKPSQVMMRCLADVMARVPLDAGLSYLTAEQNAELIDWDAEKYRQSVNK